MSVTVHVRVVTPAPTYVHCTNELSGALTGATASQSCGAPRPLVSVTVTLAPAAMLVALIVKTGAGLIVTVSVAETPPPGAGVITDTRAVPADAMSLALIDAWRTVALTNVVGRSTPFHRTTDEDTKLLPDTVSVNAGPPAMTFAGDTALTTGTGLNDGSTVTVGLVATRRLFTNSRNS